MAEIRMQRRLAAILAADVVAYSRHMEKDEVGTLSRLKAIRAELVDPNREMHHGRIINTAGDGILMEFSSALDALDYAVNVQRAMAQRNSELPKDQRIEFRIGINVGDVIVDGEDVFGDGVNVAARMEGIAPAGGICISGTVFDQVDSKTEYAFEDIGQQAVKNIARPIHAYRLVVHEPHAAAETRSTAPPSMTALLNRPAIAVLPFENLSADPQQEYFADGLTEDLISVLSGWRTFPVIARNSTFTYKGRAVKVQEVASELGARYVVEGSVRTGGKRMRIVAQLIDAESGHHIWAERYDREIGDIFDLQDEITNSIANIIEPELSKMETKRVATRQPINLGAWECYQRGMGLIGEFSKESTSQARSLFERAIDLDPTYAQAYTGLAYSHHRDMLLGFSDEPDQTLAKFGQAVRRAIALDDADPFSHWLLALYYQWMLDSDHAIAEAEKAIERNPSLSTAHATLGSILAFSGRPDEAITSIQRAFQLSPGDPRNFIYYGHLADAHLVALRFDDAADWAKKATIGNPDYLAGHVLLAASLGHAGRTEEARAGLDECYRLDPDFLNKPHGWKHYRNEANLAHIVAGLRKAGLTE